MLAAVGEVAPEQYGKQDGSYDSNDAH